MSRLRTREQLFQAALFEPKWTFSETVPQYMNQKAQMLFYSSLQKQNLTSTLTRHSYEDLRKD